MAETEGSDDTSENELLNRSLSVWKGNKETFEPIPLDYHTASSLGLYDCVKTHIIREDLDIDKRNKGGWTALMYACYIGHESIVSLLLEHGASVNLRNQKKETSLMLAASCGNDRVGTLLCSQGAELECHDERGWTALFHTTYSGHQNMVSFLLKQGANMNAVEPTLGMTPFMEAAAEGHEIILQLFLRHGVNVNTKAYNGDTARSLALINGNMKIVSLIDNHVMPITSLRAEPELGSSSDTFARTKNLRLGRGKGVGGGPSIMDGPQAIARLIDRTGKDTTQQKVPASHFPRDYVTFPEGESSSEDQKLSYRDVTSPINPEDYKLDSSGSREYNEPDDDTNAFSKTGALTIKSSSGSSGGLAAALGIRREDSLDSDEFPHESSCGDSHHHDNSGESSSDEGLEEPVQQKTLTTKPFTENQSANIDRKGEMEKKKLCSKKSKELRLTTDKVNEIEVLKNSVSEWIDSVHDTTPVPENNFETPAEGHTHVPAEGHIQVSAEGHTQVPGEGHTSIPAEGHTHVPVDEEEKDLAVKPEYQPKQKQSKAANPVLNQYSSNTMPTDTPPGHISEQLPVHKDPSLVLSSDLIEQVANNVKNHDPRPAKEFLQQNTSTDHQLSTVSALNVLNTTVEGYNPHLDNTNQNNENFLGNQGTRVQPPPGFAPPVNPYQILPQSAPVQEIPKDLPRTNTVFLEKMKDVTPKDLAALLEDLGLSKYIPTFDEQDVDLPVFLSLTDNDLKEIGIKLFGPRKKMMNAIARWHGKARISVGELEQVYADRLDGEMQEMGVQLQLAVEQLEKLKAQVKQEQQLRNVTESCLMEERGAWQHVQRIVMDTRQQCEDFKDAVRKLMQYVNELKSRTSMESNLQNQGHQKRPIRGASAFKDDKVGVLKQDSVPTDTVVRKVDYYIQEIQHLLDNVTSNTDRLLGRNTHVESPERGYPS